MGFDRPVHSDVAEFAILDKSAGDFSATYEACDVFATNDAKRVKIVVDLTTQASVTDITCKLRTSNEAAAPAKGTAADWSTRQWHGTAGDLVVTDYEPHKVVAAEGRFEFVFDVDARWCSPMVKVDVAASSRGVVYAYRSRK